MLPREVMYKSNEQGLTRRPRSREGVLQVPGQIFASFRVLPRELVDGDNDTASRERREALTGIAYPHYQTLRASAEFSVSGQ